MATRRMVSNIVPHTHQQKLHSAETLDLYLLDLPDPRRPVPSHPDKWFQTAFLLIRTSFSISPSYLLPPKADTIRDLHTARLNLSQVATKQIAYRLFSVPQAHLDDPPAVIQIPSCLLLLPCGAQIGTGKATFQA